MAGSEPVTGSTSTPPTEPPCIAWSLPLTFVAVHERVGMKGCRAASRRAETPRHRWRPDAGSNERVTLGERGVPLCPAADGSLERELAEVGPGHFEDSSR